LFFELTVCPSFHDSKFIIRAKEILFTKASLNKFMADYCDQPEEKIAADTDRDFFMTPYEALDYGLIDEVLKTKTSHIPMPAMPSLRG
jgi:ATP-dependent Clp protease, protease subunit